MKIEIGLFYQYISHTSLNQFSDANKFFKTLNSKPENSKKKKNKQTNKNNNNNNKKNTFGILKITGGILLYSKNFFFQFFKIRGGMWRTTKQLFFLGLMKKKCVFV